MVTFACSASSRRRTLPRAAKQLPDQSLAPQHRPSAFSPGSVFRGQSARHPGFYYFSRSATNSTFDIRSKRRGLRSSRIAAAALWRGTDSQPCWERARALLRQQVPGVPLSALVVPAPRDGPATRDHGWVATSYGQMLKRNKIARVDLLIDVEGAELDVLMGLDAETWPQVQRGGDGDP